LRAAGFLVVVLVALAAGFCVLFTRTALGDNTNSVVLLGDRA
jgi:hypothetical protein